MSFDNVNQISSDSVLHSNNSNNDLLAKEGIDNEYVTLIDPFEKQVWWKLFTRKEGLVVVGAMLICLLTGVPNAMGTITTNIQTEYDYSPTFMSLFLSFGLLGLYFTIPAGVLLDKFGPIPMFIVAIIVSSLSYVGMLFTSKDTWYLMMLFFLLAGFGQGTALVVSLNVCMLALPNYAGTGIALAGMCMSFSLAFLVQMVAIYNAVSSCTKTIDSCWKQWVALWDVGILIAYSIGTLLVIIGLPKQQKTKVEEQSKLSSASLALSRSTNIKRVLSDPLFISLIFAFFTGISYGLIWLTNGNFIWQNFTKCTHANWVDPIYTLFSVANAAVSLAAGPISDFLVAKKIMTRATIIGTYQFFCGIVFILLGILTQFPNENTLLHILFALLIVCVGMGWGATYTLFPTIAGEYWGSEHFGLNYGLLQLGSTVAALFTPILSTLIPSGFEVCSFYFDENRIDFWIYGALLVVVSIAVIAFEKRRQHVAKRTRPVINEETSLIY